MNPRVKALALVLGLVTLVVMAFLAGRHYPPLLSGNATETATSD